MDSSNWEFWSLTLLTWTKWQKADLNANNWVFICKILAETRNLCVCGAVLMVAEITPYFVVSRWAGDPGLTWSHVIIRAVLMTLGWHYMTLHDHTLINIAECTDLTSYSVSHSFIEFVWLRALIYSKEVNPFPNFVVSLMSYVILT